MAEPLTRERYTERRDAAALARHLQLAFQHLQTANSINHELKLRIDIPHEREVADAIEDCARKAGLRIPGES